MPTPFDATVLKPDLRRNRVDVKARLEQRSYLDLRDAQIELLGEMRSFVSDDVLLLLELGLQPSQLLAGEYRSHSFAFGWRAEMIRVERRREDGVVVRFQLVEQRVGSEW